MRLLNNRFFKQLVLFLFLLFLPTQFGKHFFPAFSYINGVKIDYVSPTLYITDIIAVALILLYRKELIQRVKRNHFVFIGLILILMIHALLTPFPLLSLYEVLKIIELSFIFFIAQHKYHPKFILTAFLLGGIVELSLSLMQLSTHTSLQGLFYLLGERYLTISHPGIATASLFGNIFLRPYGTFSHPNSMGGFYLLIYTYILTHTPFRQSFKLYTVSSFIFTALVFISFSKIAILSYMIITFFYAIRHMKIECFLCAIARTIGLIILSLIFLSSKADPLSFDKRVTLFSNGMTIFKNHFLWGVGLGHYLISAGQLRSTYPYFFLQPVHNIIVLFFAQTGAIVGLMLTLPLVKKSLPYWKKPAFFFCVLALFMTGMFDHYWFTLQQNWLLLGTVFGFLTFEQFTPSV